MDQILDFYEIKTDHIPVVNSWYYDPDSSYVEELTEQYIDYVNSTPNYYCWLVCHNDVPVGNVAYEIDEKKAYISILVRPDFRRKGYGRMIFEKVIKRPEIRSVERISAGIKHTNEKSIRFFESVGFDTKDKDIDDDGFINYIFEIIK